MLATRLKERITSDLLDFAWEQWAQMGLSATSRYRQESAMDPEVLLLLTFELGRDDPRLFDETLGWLATNARLVSVQRMNNLCVDDADRALVAGALGWTARWRRARPSSEHAESPVIETGLEPLFRGMRAPTRDLEPSYAAQGFARGDLAPSAAAREPNPTAPVNFAFRMRHLLGVGARAEVMTSLLTIDAPRVSGQVLARSAGFSKRNTREALGHLRSAGLVEAVEVGNELYYRVRREDWDRLLGLDPLRRPTHGDWVQLFAALRRVIRWLNDVEGRDLSDYMLASGARELMTEVGPDLRYAGVVVSDSGASGAAYWDDFELTIEQALPARLVR